MSDAQPYDHDLKYGFLLKVLAGTILVMVVTCTFIYWLYFFLLNLETSADPAPPILAEASLPISVPGALLLANPERELDRLNEKVGTRLNSYGWVDEASGIAHLPIDRAILLVAANGLAPKTDESPESATDEALQAPQILE